MTEFGWAAFYEAADEGRDWIAEQAAAAERRRTQEEERQKQALFRRKVAELLAQLRKDGLLRTDRLSYTRICELEWETGQRSGSWSDRYEALHEAQLLDKSP